MSRLRSFLISPPFLIPTCVLLGGLLTRASPDYSAFVDRVYGLWMPEAAPSVVLALVTGLGMVAIGTLFLSLGDFFTGTPGVKIDKQPDHANAQKSPDEARAAWVAERLAPWRKFLEDHGELALLPEIEALFVDADGKPYLTRTVEAPARDRKIMVWLVQKAVVFSHDGAACLDPSANQAKIHGFVDAAFRLASERDGWKDISKISDARSVVASIFSGQIAIYREQCAGSRSFLDFALWLAATA